MICLCVCFISLAYFCNVEAGVTTISECSAEYDITRKLGEGAYGTVYGARIKDHTTGNPNYAIKFNQDKDLHTTEKQVFEALKEESSKNKMGRHTPQYYGECIYKENENTKYGIVMEYVGNKFDTVRYSQFDIQGKISVIYQILSAIKQLHSYGFAHLDIKPDNIMGFGSDGLLKISDFGLTCWDKDNPINEYRGTPAFSAPELLAARLGLANNVNIYKADAWSAGATIFYILTGNLLLETNSETKACIRNSRAHVAKECTFQVKYKLLKEYFVYPSMKFYHLPEPEFKADCEIELNCHESKGMDISKKMWGFYTKVTQNWDSYLLQNMVFNLLTFDPSTRDTIDDALAHPIFDSAYKYQNDRYNAYGGTPGIRSLKETYVAPVMPMSLTTPVENTLTPQPKPTESFKRPTQAASTKAATRPQMTVASTDLQSEPKASTTISYPRPQTTVSNNGADIPAKPTSSSSRIERHLSPSLSDGVVKPGTKTRMDTVEKNKLASAPFVSDNDADSQAESELTNSDSHRNGLTVSLSDSGVKTDTKRGMDTVEKNKLASAASVSDNDAVSFASSDFEKHFPPSSGNSDGASIQIS